MHPIHLVGLYTTRLPVFPWKAKGYDWILVDSIGQPSLQSVKLPSYLEMFQSRENASIPSLAFSRRQNLTSMLWPRPRFYASAFHPTNPSSFFRNSTREERSLIRGLSKESHWPLIPPARAGVLPIMIYTGRPLLKGVSFSGFRCIKG